MGDGQKTGGDDVRMGDANKHKEKEKRRVYNERKTARG